MKKLNTPKKSNRNAFGVQDTSASAACVFIRHELANVHRVGQRRLTGGGGITSELTCLSLFGEKKVLSLFVYFNTHSIRRRQNVHYSCRNINDVDSNFLLWT